VEKAVFHTLLKPVSLRRRVFSESQTGESQTDSGLKHFAVVCKKSKSVTEVSDRPFRCLIIDTCQRRQNYCSKIPLCKVLHQTETFHELSDICEIKAEGGKYDLKPSV